MEYFGSSPTCLLILWFDIVSLNPQVKTQYFVCLTILFLSNRWFHHLTLSLSRSRLVILLIVFHKIFMMLVWTEFGIESTNNSLIDIFLYSHCLSASYCIDIVKRNSILVIHRSSRVKCLLLQQYKLYFPLQHPQKNFNQVTLGYSTLW